MRSTLRAIGLLIAVGVVAALPLTLSNYYTGLVINIMIYSLFALSLQLLVGGTGLVSLGHSAFFGIAAYYLALLAPEFAAGNFFTLGLGALVVTMLYALVTGALSLRTRGIYFIMVTLAFAQMAYYVFHDTKQKSTRLNSSHVAISYAVFCLKKKTHTINYRSTVTTHAQSQPYACYT